MGYTLPPREDNPLWPMPRNYPDLGGDEQRELRKTLLTGWFDENRPGELITDKEVFLAALFFYVETYVKTCKALKHHYFRADSSHKARMQRMFTNPRSAMVAPRGGTKTFTMVLETGPFIATFRPNTAILIGSETADLTVEKIKAIRARVEDLGRVVEEFGRPWPKTNRGSKDWSNKGLDFVNGSSITGSSIDSSTRGRHPMVGLIDDPEGKRSRSAKWREQFMDWLFRDYLNQFDDKGTHVMWVGTILRTDSCLWRAVHDEDEENRFAGWERDILKMVYEDPPDSGIFVSAWPEKLTVEEFEKKKNGVTDGEIDVNVTPIGFAAVMAEFQGEPVPAGEKMFHRQERKHGFLICDEPDGDGRYIYDPQEGTSHDFADFRSHCLVHGGVDIADTPAAHADPSAIVYAMLDADGTFWVIDAWEKKCFSDKTALQAMRMASEWMAVAVAWEQAALGKRIFREAFKLRQQRLQEGHHVPRLIPIDTQGVPKEHRIERLRPTFDAGRIKLPLFNAIDGHQPAKHPRSMALRHLLDQFDTMTGEGTAGHDDLLDAFEMLHRVAVKTPKKYRPEPLGRKRIRELNKHGVEVDPMQVPEENWTKKMRKDFERRLQPSVTGEGVCQDAFV